MFNVTRYSRGTIRARLLFPAVVVAAFLGTTLLSGCDQTPPLSFQNPDVTGNKQFAGHFTLPDTSGQIRTLAITAARL